jgi:hypothetical protein
MFTIDVVLSIASAEGGFACVESPSGLTMPTERLSPGEFAKDKASEIFERVVGQGRAFFHQIRHVAFIDTGTQAQVVLYAVELFGKVPLCGASWVSAHTIIEKHTHSDLMRFALLAVNHKDAK